MLVELVGQVELWVGHLVGLVLGELVGHLVVLVLGGQWAQC